MVTSVIDGTHYSANDMMKLHYIMIAIWRKKKKKHFKRQLCPLKPPESQIPSQKLLQALCSVLNTGLIVFIPDLT